MIQCAIIPMGKFGDHKGLAGCIWCSRQKACIKATSKGGDNEKEKTTRKEEQFDLKKKIKARKRLGTQTKETFRIKGRKRLG